MKSEEKNSSAPDLNAKLGEIVDIDPSIAGDEFYKNIVEHMIKAGVDLGSNSSVDAAGQDDVSLALMSESALAKITGEMEENLRISEETDPTTHRPGLVGRFHWLVKKVMIYLKLATDEQVIQQAHFNRAAFAALQLAKIREDQLMARLDRLQNEVTVLKSKVDGR